MNQAEQIRELAQSDIYDSFFRSGSRVSIYLFGSGVKLAGTILATGDKWLVLRQTGNREVLVFEHAIATIAKEHE